MVMRFRKFFPLLLAVGALCLSQMAATATAEELAFYISPEGNDSSSGTSVDKPFATLQQARDAIRAVKKRAGLSQPVTVYLRGGVYALTETFVLTPEDSGAELTPITYRAYQDEKPVLSGARTISSQWEDYQGDIKVCSLPNVQAGKLNFRQLFAGDQRQQRTRLGYEKRFRIKAPLKDDRAEKAFTFNQGDLKPWHNLNDVEVVVFLSGAESRQFIQNLDEGESIVTFSGAIGRKLTKGRRRNYYYVENVFEALDSPGQWYLDRQAGKLYYWPLDEASLSQLRVPILNELLRFQGDLDQDRYVRFVNIQGLTFAHTTCTIGPEGVASLPNSADSSQPAAITLAGVTDCKFEGNIITNVGAFALNVTGSNNLITDNEIYDTGGGAILMANHSDQPNVISYNHIHDGSKVFHSTAAIHIEAGGGLITQNHIHDMAHSGIYARHGTDDPLQSQRANQQQALTIEHNEIHHVMKLMNDGAAIAVGDSNIAINHNLIYDVRSYGNGTPGWGIYLGHNTRDATVENNLVYRTYEGLCVWHGNKNTIIKNNMFVDGESCLVNANNPKGLEREEVKFLQNIFYYSRTDADLFKIRGQQSAPTVSDHNLYWNPRGCMWLSPVIWGMRDAAYFQDWQKMGYDQNSIVQEPQFVDKANDDYSLKPNSPAFQMGFKPIDFSTVGLRGRNLK